VLDVVAVMHGLALAQGSPQQLGHHPDVLGDPARLRLGVGVVRIRAADEDIALGSTQRPLLPRAATADRAGAGWRGHGRGRLRDASWCSRETCSARASGRGDPQERRELLAAGELVEVAGAQTTGGVVVGEPLEGTGY